MSRGRPGSGVLPLRSVVSGVAEPVRGGTEQPLLSARHLPRPPRANEMPFVGQVRKWSGITRDLTSRRCEVGPGFSLPRSYPFPKTFPQKGRPWLSIALVSQ